QRVLAARLSDALFFWENDLRVAKGEGMAAMAKPLENVTFHNKLGSVAEQVERIAALAREIAPLVGADPDKAEEAARIAKTDLASEMVYEFPELQGVMGRYYALEAGHPPEVAEVCATHRSPLGPSDQVPGEPTSVAVALADKIDLLTGFWAIDEKPTGSKDPFALRRAALGMIRIVLDGGLRVSVDRLFDAQVLRHQIAAANDVESRLLDDLLAASIRHGVFGDATRAILAEDAAADVAWRHRLVEHDPSISDDLRGFVHERLKVHLRDQGVRHDVIDACRAMPENCDLVLLFRRVNALQTFLESEDGANLLTGYRRAVNILAAEEKKDGVEYTLDPNVKFAEEDAEKALFSALDKAEAAIAPALEAEDFAAAMTALAALRAPIDAFFDEVQVNSDNQIVRRNRLCLLNRIKAVMHRVAVFSEIEG
ncbi:MAG: glycine--tRNA ligase subunit beta, partial [Pseudomonadota bacterium]